MNTRGHSGHGFPGARDAGGFGMISICVTLFAPCRLAVPTQSLPVSPPPMTSTSLPAALTVRVAASPVSKRASLPRNSSAKWMPFFSRPGMAKSRALAVPRASTTASNFAFRYAGAMSRPISVPQTNAMPAFSRRAILRSMTVFSSLKFGIP